MRNCCIFSEVVHQRKWDYCFQYPLHDHTLIFKWQKDWMVFAAALFVSEEKNVIWLDVCGILMKGFVTSCQFRKPSWSGRVLHHPVSLGLGPHRPWKVCHSKNHFMSTLRPVRKLVCIYSVVRKAGTNCWRGIVEQRDIASFVSGEWNIPLVWCKGVFP